MKQARAESESVAMDHYDLCMGDPETSIHPLPVVKDEDPHLHGFPVVLSGLHPQDETSLPVFEPRVQLDDLERHCYNNNFTDDRVYNYQTPYLHMPDPEYASNWAMPTSHPYSTQFNDQPLPPTGISSLTYPPYALDAISPPYSSYCFDESSVASAWSSPGFETARPIFHPDDEEVDTPDDKPYATLIFEALLGAPNHRMMLKDIYDWFRINTTKAQDNGSNGWQNSIRHNLSMNKAFENDRGAGGGNSRKTTSVWVLTPDAIRNGVQSTTRYRKSGGGKKSLGNRATATQRQQSGARGGRATRQIRNARNRRQEGDFPSYPSPIYNPLTPSYSSDFGDYQGHGHTDLGPGFRSCPLTPVEGHGQFFDDTTPPMIFPAPTTVDFDSYRTNSVARDPGALFNLPLRSSVSQYFDETGDTHIR